MTDSQKKKVFIAITQSNYGGAQKYVYDLARSLPTDTYDVTVVFGEGGILGELLTKEGIRTIAIDSLVRRMSLISEIKTFITFYRLLRKERPDILHSNSSKMGGIGAVVGRVAGVPHVVFTCHGWAFNEARPLWQRTLIYIFSWFIVFFSHTTIFVSEATRRQMRLVPFARRKMHVVHNGIAPVTFHTREAARAVIAERAPILKNSIRELWIGTVAELHPVKNLDVAISSYAKLVDIFPNARWIVLGEGQYRPTLEAAIRSHKLESRFILAGHITQAVTLMKAFDVFCLPSRSESFAQTVLEAGSAAVPVVASRVGGIPELIRDDSFGLLVTPGDAEALATSLITLIKEDEKRKELGLALQQRVASEFSLDTMVRKTIEVYYS